MLAETFDFEGRTVTAQDLAAEFTAYSESWLRDSLRAGCTDRHQMFAHAQKNRSNAQHGAVKGKKTFQARHPLTRQYVLAKAVR